MEAFVEAKAEDVGERGAGGGALWETARGAGDVVGGAVEGEGGGVGAGADEREERGERFGVAEGLKEAFDAWVGDGGEKILEVGVDDDVGLRVWCGVGEDGASGAEAVGGVVEGDAVEDVEEDPVLSALEARHGGGDGA